MTKRETLYKYLSGGISNRSFRKWLLALDNNDHFFLESDFAQLKTLAIIFSDPKKIKDVIQNYVDISIINKIVLNKEFNNLIENDEDILIKLNKLKYLAKQLEDIEMMEFVKPYNSVFQSTPQLIERKNWNEEIFIEKRRVLESHKKKIMDTIIKFGKNYYFEYKE